MARQKQATRKRLAKLAASCGFEAFSGVQLGDKRELGQVLNEIPDADLEEAEDILEMFADLQDALRSLN